MINARSFISGIAFRTGDRRPLSALTTEIRRADSSIESLHGNGLSCFCENGESLARVCMQAARETLTLTSTSTQQIRTVILAGSNSDAIVSDNDETDFFIALNELGINHAHVVGLSMLSCSAHADALTLASTLVNLHGDSALVIVFGERKKMSRVVPQGNIVFSDGAVSCIVDTRPAGFEICANDSLTDTALGMLDRGGSLRHLGDGVRAMHLLTTRLYETSGVKPEDLRAFFGINAGITQLRIMAQAAGVPLELAYDADIGRYAHLHSCDALIALRNYAQNHELRNGDAFLLMAWSPHIVAGSVLRYAGHA